MTAKQKRILKMPDNAIQGRENGIAVESFCCTPSFTVQALPIRNDERSK